METQQDQSTIINKVLRFLNPLISKCCNPCSQTKPDEFDIFRSHMYQNLKRKPIKITALGGCAPTLGDSQTSNRIK
ncbi:hypothetical protein EUGRSUZ_F02119 [Eucalyptus grandis]|uniref:Uncharacterized protein n=2 Tax=Eucalyptus grandis TaxID=71139 RepID=A0ACC3KHP4_EUCGR|nr:hypothetical protein EUGRSUZ_F02119 [Eucalyptus grandis]